MEVQSSPCLANGGVCPISLNHAEVWRRSPPKKARFVPQFPLLLQREEQGTQGPALGRREAVTSQGIAGRAGGAALS